MPRIVSWKTGELLSSISGSLRGSDLRGRNLRYANLDKKRLLGADLRGSDLRGSSLKSADLRGADLSGADLRGADLKGCNLSKANLASCNFSRCNLLSARLDGASVAFADFNRASMGYNALTNIDDLHLALRLECARHKAPSILNEHTIDASLGLLPTSFLLGAGLESASIVRPSAMPSCFISHATGDAVFADRLYEDLRRRGVMCWHFAHSMKAGLPWRTQIDEAIAAHDRLILVCSRRAVYRENVVHEVLQALKCERETGERKLFPVRLDDHILSQFMVEEAREKVRSGEWLENWVFYVRELQILDFCGWKNPESYASSLDRLVDALELNS